MNETVTVSQLGIERYARAWMAGVPLPDGSVSSEEQQVALVLAGYDTPTQCEMLGISDEARSFAARHWPNGLD